MAKGDGYVKYAKQRDATAGQDGWAKLKQWKDPMGGASDPAMGNSPYAKGKPMKGAKGYGMNPVDGASDYTYDGLNKPSDSTA